MSEAKPLNPLVLKYQALAVGALGVGVAFVSEVFAPSIGASGLIHPVWHGLYSPADTWKLLAELDRNCIVQPAIAHFHNETITWAKPMPELHCPHAAAIASLNTHVAPWAAAALAPPLWFLAASGAAAKIKPGGRVLPGPKRGKGHVSICLGISTGTLWQLGLPTGLKRKQKVWIVNKNLSQDMLVVGGKGAGKTNFLNAYFSQAFKQGCGGLFLNVKGDYDFALKKLAKRAGRTIRVIGIGGESVNLMEGTRTEGVTPKLAATYLQTSLRLIDKTPSATFWSNIASNLSGGAFRLLVYFRDFYTLPGLRRFLFDKEFRKFILTQVNEAQDRLRIAYSQVTDEALKEEMKADGLNMAAGLQALEEFSNETAEVQGHVLTQLTQVLSGMCEPEMAAAFFNTTSTAVPFDLRDTYEKATIFCINAPMAFYGASARAAQAWVKFRFYGTMDQRRVLMARGEANTETIVIFGVDECQATLTVDENSNFSDDQWLATSRDTKTACVWATQSIPALRKAAGGIDACDAVTANLRHQVFFRSEDIKTVKDVLDLLGTTREKKKSESKGGKGGKSTTESEETRIVAQPGDVRKLKRRQAFMLADIDGEAADDIIDTRAVYA